MIQERLEKGMVYFTFKIIIFIGKVLLVQIRVRNNNELRVSISSLWYSLKDTLSLKLQFPQPMYSFGLFN